MKITFITSQLNTLNTKEDGTLNLAKTAKAMGHNIKIIQNDDISYINGEITSIAYSTDLKATSMFNLSKSDIILMRVDPPFNINYIYLTYLLDKIKVINPQVKILNPPNILREWNEKMSILQFENLIPPTLVTKQKSEILKFAKKFKDGIILKPLDQKGGEGIVWLKTNYSNEKKEEMIKKITKNETEFVMIQKFIVEAAKGDHRITIVNKKIAHSILRVPKKGSFLGNICQGATAMKHEVSKGELKAVKQVMKKLNEKGAFIAGLDFLGEYLTEINVTSPITGFNLYPEINKKIIKELGTLI